MSPHTAHNWLGGTASCADDEDEDEFAPTRFEFVFRWWWWCCCCCCGCWWKLWLAKFKVDDEVVDGDDDDDDEDKEDDAIRELLECVCELLLFNVKFECCCCCWWCIKFDFWNLFVVFKLTGVWAWPEVVLVVVVVTGDCWLASKLKEK